MALKKLLGTVLISPIGFPLLLKEGLVGVSLNNNNNNNPLVLE